MNARLARTTAILYSALAVLGLFAPAVLGSLVQEGHAAETARAIQGSLWLFGSSVAAWTVMVIVDLAIAATLYLLLRPASRSLALVAAAFRVAYATILAAFLVDLYDAFLLLTGVRGADLAVAQRQALALSSLDTFNAGFWFAMTFFGVHLVALGVLFYRSRYVPRALAALLSAAGVGYVAHSAGYFSLPDHGGPASAALLLPALVGELALIAWLFVKGVDARPQAARTSADTRSTARSFAGAKGGAR